MDSLLQAYNLLEKEVYSLEGVQKSLSSGITELEDKLNTNKSNKELYLKCIEILDISQKLLQERMKEGFEIVATNALQSVFGVGYKLELEFDRRGAIPEVNVYIKTPEMTELHDPEDSNAGGQKDLISMILKMVVLSFVQPEGGTPIKMDEPCAQLGAGNTDDLGKCLKTLIKKFNRQAIIVTHNQGLLEFADNKLEFK